MQYNPSSDKTEKAAFYTIILCSLGGAGWGGLAEWDVFEKLRGQAV